MLQFDVLFHFITSVSLRDSRWHSFLAVYSRRCDTISPLWQPLKMDLHPDSTDLNMSTWPYQSILQAFYLMDYPNAAMTTWSSTGNRFTSCQSLQPHNWNYWRWTSWKKPSRSFVGNASRLAFWRGTSRCGFKLLHTTLQNSPMDILAPSTMTWPGRKSLTITGSHMITDTFTFELSLPTTHKSEQDDDFNLVQLQALLLLSDLPPFQTHCSKEKELGPCIGIAGAKLSTPKKTLLWLLICVVAADFPFTFWRSFRAPIFPTSTLTPWRSKEQFRTFYFYAEPPRSHTGDSLSVDQPCYQHYARQLSDKTQQSSSRFQCTTTAHIGMTENQKFRFLEHIAKVFFFVLQEFMNNQQNRPPHRNIQDFPEAFHRSLFDLRILTDQFLENSVDNYNLAARILHLMANASNEEEDQLLQFALQELRHRYPQTERSPLTALIEWLWHQHHESLQRQPIDLGAVQAFFHIT